MNDRQKEIAATEWLEDLLLSASRDDRGAFFAALHQLIDLAKDDALPIADEAVASWQNAMGAS